MEGCFNRESAEPTIFTDIRTLGRFKSLSPHPSGGIEPRTPVTSPVGPIIDPRTLGVRGGRHGTRRKTI
jgi:hypothetical protein